MDNHQQLVALCCQFNALFLGEEETLVRIAVPPNPPPQLFEALRFVCDKLISVSTGPQSVWKKSGIYPPVRQPTNGRKTDPRLSRGLMTHYKKPLKCALLIFMSSRVKIIAESDFVLMGYYSSSRYCHCL